MTKPIVKEPVSEPDKGPTELWEPRNVGTGIVALVGWVIASPDRSWRATGALAALGVVVAEILWGTHAVEGRYAVVLGATSLGVAGASSGALMARRMVSRRRNKPKPPKPPKPPTRAEPEGRDGPG